MTIVYSTLNPKEWKPVQEVSVPRKPRTHVDIDMRVECVRCGMKYETLDYQCETCPSCTRIEIMGGLK